MKKVYKAPQIAVENFVLNEFIAGSCKVPTRNKDKEEWYELLDPFTQAAVDMGQFAGDLGCVYDADDDNDTICYHTQGSPLFTS